jgi:hypothetical protein
MRRLEEEVTDDGERAPGTARGAAAAEGPGR